MSAMDSNLSSNAFLLDCLRQTVNASPEADFPAMAAVALVVCRADHLPCILFIKRSIHPNDPWAGHIAFPGGRKDFGDRDSLATVQRETYEEIGLQLASQAMHVGQLTPIQARSSRKIEDFHIVPHLFFLPGDEVSFIPNDEVVAVELIPLTHLFDRENVVYLANDTPEGIRQFPGIAYKSEVIWGLTYYMLVEFLTRLQGSSFCRILHESLGGNAVMRWPTAILLG